MYRQSQEKEYLATLVSLSRGIRTIAVGYPNVSNVLIL